MGRYFLEPYAGGFIIADYPNDDDVRYCGEDMKWKRQPLFNQCEVFKTKENAEDAIKNIKEPK